MSETFFPKEKADLFRRQHCEGWTEDQFAEFMHAVKRFRLDPMARQIHGVIRHDKNRGQVLAIQTGIDGYRLIADRTGALAGNDDAVFSGGPTGGCPAMATVTVHKMVGGERCPFSASARWAEYCPDGNQAYMWRKMPHVMLGKCAEALALRKAFPAELCGLYTNEEMQQADGKAPAGDDQKPPKAPALPEVQAAIDGMTTLKPVKGKPDTSVEAAYRKYDLGNHELKREAADKASDLVLDALAKADNPKTVKAVGVWAKKWRIFDDSQNEIIDSKIGVRLEDLADMVGQ